MRLLSGFIIRAYANLTTPRQLLEMIQDWQEQLAKTEPSRDLESPI